MNPVLLKLLPQLISVAETLLVELVKWLESQNKEGAEEPKELPAKKKEKVKREVKEKIEQMEEKVAAVPTAAQVKEALTAYKNKTSYADAIAVLKKYAPTIDQIPEEQRAAILEELNG